MKQKFYKNNKGFMALGMTLLVSIGIYGIIEAVLYKNIVDNAVNQMDKIMESIEDTNYTILDDGTKVNINENVKNTRITLDEVSVYGFEIKYSKGVSTVSCFIENMSNQKVEKRFKISLYNEEEEVLTEYLILAVLDSKKTTISTTNLMVDVSDASSIVVEEYN